MDESTLYEHILGVTHPWFVEQVALENDIVHVHVSYDPDTLLNCPKCAKACTQYDSKSRTWRHLDTCQYQTLVHCNVPRADCPKHGALQLEVPWANKNGRFTQLFESAVIDWLQELSINAVTRRFQLSWNAVDSILRDAVNRGMSLRKKPCLRHLAVDEVSRKKGHHYVTVISNKEGQVIDVCDGKDKASLSAFYVSLNQKQLASIETISMDMSPSYVYATLEHIPHAKDKICFDKFHVIQDLNKAVDGVRRSEIARIEKTHRKSLHLSRFIWLRNEQNLSEIHVQIKEHLTHVAVKTARAHAIAQYAKSLWCYRYPESAEKAWSKWIGWAVRSRLQPIKTVAMSIREKLWGIVNAITKQQSNAMAESLNAKLKMIKVRAKGYRNEVRFKRIIMFYLGKLDLKY